MKKLNFIATALMSIGFAGVHASEQTQQCVPPYMLEKIYLADFNAGRASVSEVLSKEKFEAAVHMAANYGDTETVLVYLGNAYKAIELGYPATNEQKKQLNKVIEEFKLPVEKFAVQSSAQEQKLRMLAAAKMAHANA